MKVTVIMSNPGFYDITMEELENAWKVLDNIPDLEVTYNKFDSESPYSDILNSISSDTEAVLGLFILDNVINKEFLDTHPKLKYISTLAHGFGTFDKELTQKRNIVMTNTIYGDITIAQYAFALLLDICHNVGRHSHYIKDEYLHDTSDDRSFQKVFSKQIELYNKTFGIWGLGNIGYCAAKIARGFGMNVIAYSRHKKTDPKYDFIKQVSLDELLEQSDVISLHTPLTKYTENMVNKETISKMKDGVILINTARGKLIVEEDLVEALNSGKIFAAGLDVLREEPMTEHIPLLDCPNSTITGHIAWYPKESRFRAIKLAIDNFKNYLDGNPTSVINK